MTVEYWLLKKTLGAWTKVSWWSEEEKDKATVVYQKAINNGYAIRLVKVDVELEYLLNDMSEDFKDDTPDEIIKNPAPVGWGSSWGSKPLPDAPSPTVTPSNTNLWLASQPPVAHGLAGKVWLGNPITKEKKRVDPNEVSDMMANGWMRCGPRTVL